MKRCYKCKNTKPLSEFSKDKHQKDGIQRRCKECDKIRNRLYAESHREYFRRKGKERYNPGDNPARYAAKREKFLEQRSAYCKSEHGRMMTLLCSAKRRANLAGLEYDLDIEWLENLWNQQDGCCLLTSIKFMLEANSGSKRKLKPYSPSLDRIDPQKGYTKDNTRLVCTFINLAMNHFGESVFADVATAYLNSNKSCEPNLLTVF